MLLYGVLFPCLHPLIIIALFDELRPFTVSENEVSYKWTFVNHYQLYNIYRHYLTLTDNDQRSVYCMEKNLLPQVMMEIELKCGKIMKNLKNMFCLFTEYATHPLHRINAGVAPLISALIFACHPDHFCTSLGLGNKKIRLQNVKHKLNLDVDADPQT